MKIDFLLLIGTKSTSKYESLLGCWGYVHFAGDIMNFMLMLI